MAENKISLRDIIRDAAAKATDAQRQQALKDAAEYIDGLPFAGERLTSVQTSAWPRSGIVGPDGQPITGTPAQVKEATVLVAGLLLARVPYTPEAAALVRAVVHGLLRPGAEHLASPTGLH